MGLAILKAAKVKRYGVSMSDRIEEAGPGLMKAADKLGRNRVWTGSTSSWKPLFFNMRRVQARFEREVMAVGEALDRHQLRQMVATEVGAPVHDVEMMEGRLAASGFRWIPRNPLRVRARRRRNWSSHFHGSAQLRDWLTASMKALNERELRAADAGEFGQ